MRKKMILQCPVLWDMRLQFKHGFYLLYLILTVIYLVVLSALPEGWRENAAVILIFSDPAAMGLFFMGAMILFEKSQSVHSALAVSPLSAGGYILSKVLSLGIISVLVAAVLAMGASVLLLPEVIVATTVASMIFTLLGIIVAAHIDSLNQFLLWTVPVEMLCFVPALLYLFDVTPPIFRYYPINVCMGLMAGRPVSWTEILSALLFVVILYLAACKCVKKMWRCSGGVRL